MDMKTSDLSPEARRVLDTLNDKQRKVIQKDNPFLNERDNTIRELRERGVKIHILSEITGLSRNGIFEIVKRKAKSKNKAPENTTPALKNLKRAFEAFYKALLLVLSKAKGKRGDGS